MPALEQLEWYVATLSSAAVVFTLGLILAGAPFGELWAVGALAAVAALAERRSIRVTVNLEVSISLVPTLVAVVLFGPLAAMAVAAASMLPDLRKRDEERPILRWATYTSTRVITAGCAGVVALATYALSDGGMTAIVVATALGALLAEILDIGFAALTLRIRRRARLTEVVGALGPLALASVPIYAPVVAIVAVAYAELSPLTLPLFLVPALAAHQLYAMYESQRGLTGELMDVNSTLEQANLSFATALVATLDARDAYTAGHSTAVAVYARDIAARMDLSARERELAYLCGLVHDIGKVGLPTGLLEKKGSLSLEERRVMQEHSAIGERILSNVHGYRDIAVVVRHHHERVDGLGYPDGLTADEIPLLARILAVADAYDAMTSHRPYREAMHSRVARLRLAQAVGSQFDISVVATFEAILASATEEYRSGRAMRMTNSKTQRDPRSSWRPVARSAQSMSAALELSPANAKL